MRRRYIAVKIDSEKTFDRKDFSDAVWMSVLRLFGEHGANQTALSIIEYDPQTNQAILRCSHTALDMVRTSVLAITEIEKEKIIPQILLISGTLKSLRRKLKKDYN